MRKDKAEKGEATPRYPLLRSLRCVRGQSGTRRQQGLLYLTAVSYSCILVLVCSTVVKRVTFSCAEVGVKCVS